MGMGFPNFRAAAAAALALSSFALAGEALAQDRTFCARLERVILDGPNKFRSFKTGNYYQETDEWDSSVMLPGMRFCRIDVELDNFNCWNSGLSAAEAESQAGRFQSQISACFPSVKPSDNWDEDGDRIRATTQWTLPEGRRVRVVKRIHKRERGRDQVFIYVN